MKNINWLKEIIIDKLKYIWKKLKTFFKRISECIRLKRKHFMTYGIIILVSLLFMAVLNILSSHIARAVPDQNSYLAWGGKDYAQVSCFTSRADAFTTDELMRFEYELEKTLKDSTDDTSKWTDAYSGKGTLTVTNGNTSVKGTAYGVGNDFFLFHPLQLVSGGYIDNDYVMKDYILLDEESAWLLFGSANVAGLSVNINDEPYLIAGVLKKPDNRFNNASGNGEITFYVSYEALKKYDEKAAVTCYEVMMTNPVPHYAYDYVKKYFQTEDSENGASESADTAESDRNISVIENSDRSSFRSLWNHLKNFGINAMDLDEISYPYWENVAMAYDSVLSFILCVRLLAILPALICVLLGLLEIYRSGKQKNTLAPEKTF